jgi:hypothetical protein
MSFSYLSKRIERQKSSLKFLYKKPLLARKLAVQLLASSVNATDLKLEIDQADAAWIGSSILV